MNFELDRIKKLYTISNMVRIRTNGGKAGDRVYFRNGTGSIGAVCLTNIKAGEAIAILTDKGNWYLLGEADNTENASTKRIVEYRKTQPIAVVEQANIKVLFSEVQDSERRFYVLDEKSKKGILAIASTINEDFIQGNIFNYGGKGKYTNSIQYIESSKLNAFNIVSGEDYPLWDVEQIYSSGNIPYLGSSILSSQYFDVPYIEGENTSSTTYSGGVTTPGTIREITSNTILNIATPSIYFSLSGSDSLNSLAEYQNDNGSGEPGYSTYYQLTAFNLNIGTKSFYLNKKVANNNAFTINQENSSLYTAVLATAGFSSSSNTINQSTNINGFIYLGQYVPETVSNEFTQTNGTVINTIQNLISGSIVTTSSVSTVTNQINANLLLIQGINSEIVSTVNYNKVTVTDLLTNISTPTITDEIDYYLYTSFNNPIALNKTSVVVIQNFTVKIADNSTTTVIASTSLDLTGYIGESVSYAQYIDSSSSWLASGIISSVVANVVDETTTYTVTISLSSVATTNFVSYATTNGTAISNNGSLFSLLGIFQTPTTVIDRYVLLNSYDIGYLPSFTELLKYGCLIGSKFYICQNNENIKTNKTNLYVEQWDINSDGNITRNDKLLRVAVNSLNSPDSIIHSIQYWNKK